MDRDFTVAALANHGLEAIGRLARQGTTGGDDRDFHCCCLGRDSERPQWGEADIGPSGRNGWKAATTNIGQVYGPTIAL